MSIKNCPSARAAGAVNIAAAKANDNTDTTASTFFPFLIAEPPGWIYRLIK
jgi:hypothetical protein